MVDNIWVYFWKQLFICQNKYLQYWVTDVSIKKTDVNDFFFFLPTPIFSLNWPILLMCLAEHTSLTGGLIWSEGSFSHIRVCQMRETSPSCLTNTVKCFCLVRCCSPGDFSLFILWLQAYPSCKVLWRWWSCLVIFLLNSPGQLFSKELQRSAEH